MSLRLSNPVNRNHPLNYQRYGWWLALPGLEGGAYYYDLMGLHPGALTNMGSGTLRGWTTPTRPGGFAELQFAGVTAGSYVNIPISTTLSDATISVWFNATGACQYGRVMDAKFNGCFWIGRNSTANQFAAGFAVATGSLGCVANVTNNLWNHFLLTRVAATGLNTLYVNGASAGLVTPTATGPTGSLTLSTLTFGIDQTDNPNSWPFLGHADDFSIWKRCLSPAEAWSIYDLSRRGYPGVLNRIRHRAPSLSTALFRRTLFDRAGSRGAA